MNTNIPPNFPANQLSEAAGEAARKAGAAAKDVTDAAKDAGQTVSSKVEEGVETAKGHGRHAVEATKEAAHRATDTAKEVYRSAALKAGDTLATSKQYVRQNPLSIVLGAFVFGAAIGCLVMSARRKPTFGERFMDEPVTSVREAILASLAPVTRRVHDSYDAARDGVGKAMDRVHRGSHGHVVDSFSDRIGRVGSNLKFW